jgi:hypothetical protein
VWCPDQPHYVSALYVDWRFSDVSLGLRAKFREWPSALPNQQYGFGVYGVADTSEMNRK